MNYNLNKKNNKKPENLSSNNGEIEINIASVVCGGKNRARYALPLIKSAILFSESKLNIHLFTDLSSKKEIKMIVI